MLAQYIAIFLRSVLFSQYEEMLREIECELQQYIIAEEWAVSPFEKMLSE